MAVSWIFSAVDSRLVALWPGAEDYHPRVDLEIPLKAAQIQCVAFAPALAAGADVPDNYIAAQVLQARALVRAGISGDGDKGGGYGETVTVFPMDWTVKSLLRPKRGKPYFGGTK